MDFSEFESFRAELRSLNDSIEGLEPKTLRDDQLRERFRTLFRVWASSVEPSVRERFGKSPNFFKLAEEIEKLAQLASKAKRIADYKRRLRTATQLADSLIIYLPASNFVTTGTEPKRAGLFISGIPDLPVALVPNAIFGWRSHLAAFVDKYPFEKSVFIMIRYRRRNESVINAVKNSLRARGFFGVLAADHKLTDDLYNPVACLLCCSRGIAVFDRAETDEAFNPNVAYELGMLHLLGRPCLLLKHQSLRTLQTDILMKLYNPYRKLSDVKKLVLDWTPDTISS